MEATPSLYALSPAALVIAGMCAILAGAAVLAVSALVREHLADDRSRGRGSTLAPEHRVG